MSDFYAKLPPVESFDALCDTRAFTPLPDDWQLAVADVAGSTRAIAEGRYKAVNTVGVAVIAAVTNAVRPADLPYVFGGDGAIVCVPGSGAAAARKALAATAAMARSAFDMELRVGLVPVAYLRSLGHEVAVARHRVSPHYEQCALQCALHGAGAPTAETLLKSGALPPEFRIDADATEEADYSGLECRWREIPSPSDETVAVIVQVAAGVDAPLAVYRSVIATIEQIYGGADACRPVSRQGLHVTLASTVLEHEARVRTWRDGWAARLRYALSQRLQVVLGWLFFATDARTGDTDWSIYKDDAVANTDFRKFDGCLRLVLAGTEDQRVALDNCLDERRRAGELTYGMHVSDSAIMTCLVKQRQHDHVHFVDASGGGYAAAAKMMKAM